MRLHVNRLAIAIVLAVSIARPAGATPQALNAGDVSGVIARVVVAAQARGLAATIAVTDRVGTVLALWQMPGAPASFPVIGNPPPSGTSTAAAGTLSLNNVPLPPTAIAIAKAVTGSYLSSSLGNAFTTRTASQIIQDHFDPGTANAPSGPLYGVQFSQLSCSDLLNNAYTQTMGPHRSPLGLAGDPGGLPLYKGGQLVGAVGVKAVGPYGLDLNIHTNDNSVDETLAVQGAAGFPAPAGILASRITVGGLLLKYTDVPSNLATAPATPPLSALPGGLTSFPGYYNAAGGILNGNAYGTPSSGLVQDTTGEISTTSPPFILTTGYCPNGICQLRYPAMAGQGPGALTQNEVLTILRSAYAVALKTRAQLRLGAAAAINISVVDAYGTILGIISVADAPLFGIDVSLQKARSALYLSSPSTQMSLAYAPYYIAQFGAEAESFFGRPVFNGSVAWSERSIGTIARDTFPDGIAGSPNGPLALPANQSNPFADGLQEAIALPYIVAELGGADYTYCSGFLGAPPGSPTGFPILSNGLQIFPGGFPIYRNGSLIGGIGVSGDGVDQDDLISFLGLYNASLALDSGVTPAPAAIRSNLLKAFGTSPVYVNCPYAPFLNSNSNNVCSGK